LPLAYTSGSLRAYYSGGGIEMYEIIIRVLDERIAELCQEKIERVLGYNSVIRERVEEVVEEK